MARWLDGIDGGGRETSVMLTVRRPRDIVPTNFVTVTGHAIVKGYRWPRVRTDFDRLPPTLSSEGIGNTSY